MQKQLIDLEGELVKCGLPKMDPRVDRIWSAHIENEHAHDLAPFALGVAWGRLQAGQEGGA